MHPHTHSLKQILRLAQTHAAVSIQQITKELAGKGPFVLLVLLSLPFCLPLQIPGLSTPFGLVLASLGVRVMLGGKLWLPQWVLRKRVPSKQMRSLVKKVMRGVKWTQKFLHPRGKKLMRSKALRKVTGVLIAVLGLLLALPLPLPASNLLSAIPIFCMSLSYLEEDGLLLMVGHGLAVVCLGIFGTLFWAGWEFL